MGGSPILGSASGQSIVVSVGDMAVMSEKGGTLTTYALGTCIGVVFYTAQPCVGGMLHFMLPDSSLSSERAAARPAMFGDTGIPAMLEAFEAAGGRTESMKVLIAGGASMMGQNDFLKIGHKNVAKARELFEKMGIEADYEEILGNNNRTLQLKLETGQVTIKTPVGSKVINLL